jgi:hypothetical protein
MAPRRFSLGHHSSLVCREHAGMASWGWRHRPRCRRIRGVQWISDQKISDQERWGANTPPENRIGNRTSLCRRALSHRQKATASYHETRSRG